MIAAVKSYLNDHSGILFQNVLKEKTEKRQVKCVDLLSENIEKNVGFMALGHSNFFFGQIHFHHRPLD